MGQTHGASITFETDVAALFQIQGGATSALKRVFGGWAPGSITASSDGPGAANPRCCAHG